MVAQIRLCLCRSPPESSITRIDSRGKGRATLGVQIAHQILAQPTALGVAAALVATFLIVPGLPAWPFLTLALLLGGAGSWPQGT